MAASDRVAVLAHGSGSTGAFLRRAFGPDLLAAGWRLAVVEDRTGSVSEVERALATAASRTCVALVGGVSLGAHAAVRWAAGHRHRDPMALLLVMPAWTGEPGPVAAASSAAADRVEEVGVDAALRELRDGSWVAEELAAAWPEYGSALAAALHATAGSSGPSLDELRRIDVPTALVSVRGDALHPTAVAEEWAGLIPGAAHVVLDPDEPGRDLRSLGRAAVNALCQAGVDLSGSR